MTSAAQPHLTSARSYRSWASYKINQTTDKIGVFVSIVSTKIPFKGTGKEYIGDDIPEIAAAVKVSQWPVIRVSVLCYPISALHSAAVAGLSAGVRNRATIRRHCARHIQNDGLLAKNTVESSSLVSKLTSESALASPMPVLERIWRFLADSSPSCSPVLFLPLLRSDHLTTCIILQVRMADASGPKTGDRVLLGPPTALVF